MAAFMSENEANGRVFLERTGAGRCVWHSEVRDGVLGFRDETGRRHGEPPLTAEAVTTALVAALDGGCRAAAAGLGAELARYRARQPDVVLAAFAALA